jgi:hypothetical protein
MKIADSMNRSVPPSERIVDAWIHTLCPDCDVKYALTDLDLWETIDRGEYVCPRCRTVIVEVDRLPTGEIEQRCKDGMWIERPRLPRAPKGRADAC